jgi:hypothetical protein
LTTPVWPTSIWGGPIDGRETGQFCSDAVVSDAHWNPEIATLIGHGNEGVAGIDVGRGHGDTRQNSAGGICHGAGHDGILRVPHGGQRDEHPQH